MFKLESVRKAITGLKVDENAVPELVTAPSKGILRLNTKAVRELNADEIHRIVIQPIVGEDGNEYFGFYLAPVRYVKGTDGKLATRNVAEEGEEEKLVEVEERWWTPTEAAAAFIDVNNKGRKLSYTNSKNGPLQFSGEYEWSQMGGVTEELIVYGVPALNGNDDYKLPIGTTEDGKDVFYYILEKTGTREKIARGPKGESEDAANLDDQNED